MNLDIPKAVAPASWYVELSGTTATESPLNRMRGGVRSTTVYTRLAVLDSCLELATVYSTV